MALIQILIAALIIFLILFILVVITALPLHFGVRLLNGKTTIFKSFLMTIVSQFFTSFITIRLGSIGLTRIIIGLLGLFLLIWMYREIFRLRWHKALLLWFLYMIFAFLFQIMIGILLVFIRGIIPFSIPFLFV